MCIQADYGKFELDKADDFESTDPFDGSYCFHLSLDSL